MALALSAVCSVMVHCCRGIVTILIFFCSHDDMIAACWAGVISVRVQTRQWNAGIYMEWQNPSVLAFCEHCSRKACTLRLILNVMVLSVSHASRYSEPFARVFVQC
uniref:Secreted protein n=1 Tax=Rhipicephalus appendiculatus TaxID=34631 RepID=A0A131YAT3_RHIAP